ncbi:hypothetical protein EPN16_00615, partial [bacterium]
PMGLLLKSEPAVLEAVAAMTSKAGDFTNLTTQAFLLNNLLPVTVGNIVGGGLLVGLVYWFVYLRGKKE